MRFMVGVHAADGGWEIAGSLDGVPRVFLRHVAAEDTARELADRFRAGADAYTRGDWEAALEALSALAAAGCGDAQTMVGTLYHLGLGVAVDPEQARAWYERAAAAGDPLAMWNLGVMLSGAEGAEWQRRAVAMGFELGAVASPAAEVD